MTTSRKMSLRSVISREDVKITPAQLGYFKARAEAKAHATVLKLFMELSREGRVSKAFLARRLGKKPEQITRWLGAPGNWTLGSLSNLLAAMGYEVNISAVPLNDLTRSNVHHPAAIQEAKDRLAHRTKNSGSHTIVEDVNFSIGKMPDVTGNFVIR